MELLCSVCEKVCGSFTVKDGKIIYFGLTGQKIFDETNKVLEALLKNDVKSAHKELSKEKGLMKDTGIDCYCPQCDKTYCKDHYTLFEVRDDDGMYDKTLATCPKGHERKVDD